MSRPPLHSGEARLTNATADLSRGEVLVGELEIDGAEIHVVGVGEAEHRASREAILGWVRSSAAAVSRFYGRFPVKRLTITLQPGEEPGITEGLALDGRQIRLSVGRKTTPLDLLDDWRLTHEMFHLGFPDLGEQYLWMNEGLSDYLEPLARCRAGALDTRAVWKGFVEGLPDGVPGPGDSGLNHTQSWGRVYWGGTLFWLMADVEVREQTHNRRSVDDAIRAILRAGGDGGKHWAVDRVLRAADAATGTSVFSELQVKMGEAPWSPDLDELWARLGVKYKAGSVTFDDEAPLTEVRRAILGESPLR